MAAAFGKIERWHKSLKSECIRPGTPLSLGDAQRLVQGYVEHYNNIRLNSAIGYITPKDMLAGRQEDIHTERDRRLDEQLLAHPEIRCIIIDPILQHVISEKEQDVRRGVSTLLGLLQKHNIALLYVCHFNKVAGKNLSSPLDKLSGAKAWVGLPRFVFAVMPDSRVTPPVHYLICAKHNISAGIRSQSFAIESACEGLQISDIPRIRWTGESDISMITLLNLPNDGGTAGTALNDAMSLLESELTDQPRLSNEIIAVLADAGISEKTRNRAKSGLVLKGVMAPPRNEGGRWYWRLA